MNLIFALIAVVFTTVYADVSAFPCYYESKVYSNYEHSYIYGYVSSADNEYIIIDTVDGNGWAVEKGFADLSYGDCVAILFDNMGTPSYIYDDEIIDIIVINSGCTRCYNVLIN